MKPNTKKNATILALALALLLLAGCGAGSGNAPGEKARAEPAAGQGADTEPAAGSFVGEIPEADAFVALIAEEPEAGEHSRKVRAYLCDGKRNPLSEWFTGSAEGNGFDLASESGARLEGELTPEGASGTVTLKSGETFHFEVTPATGVAGL